MKIKIKIVDDAINNMIQFIRCSSCEYYCAENSIWTKQPYDNFKIQRNQRPKINIGCCPKRYPASMWLRQLAGVMNK